MIKMSQTRRQTSAWREATKVTCPVSSSKGHVKIQWLIPESPGLQACGDAVRGVIDVSSTGMLSQQKGPEVERSLRKDDPL